MNRFPVGGGLLLAALLLAGCNDNSRALPSDLGPTPTPTASPSPTPALVGQWLTTDAHVHTDHSSDGSAFRQLSSDALPGNVSIADQIGQGLLRGLDFMALTDHRTYDQHWDPLWASHDLLLIPGEEANGSPHANIFGAVDTVLDGQDGPEGAAHKPTQQSIWDAHAQGAVWQVNHPNRDSMNEDGSANDQGSVVGANLIEVWNVAEDIELQLNYAESRWNLGYETGISASSDNHFRELWLLGFGPGTVHTHVFAANDSERGILDGLRRGRTTLSDGRPLAAFLTMEADADGDGVFEAINGDTVTAAPGQTITFRFRARRAIGQTLQVIAQPGRMLPPVAVFSPRLPDETFTWTLTMPAQPSWVRAELRGVGMGLPDDDALPRNERSRRALTSPIFLRPTGMIVTPAGERPVPADAGPADSAERIIGPDGQFTGFPDAVTLADGTLLVVAETHDATGTDIWLRRGDADPVMLNVVAGFARFPRIAAVGDQVWVAWEDERVGQRPRQPRILLRGSLDGGRSWGAEQVLDSGPARSIRPALAVMADGRPVVAWSDNRRRCFDLYVQIGVDGTSQSLSDDKACTPGTLVDTRSSRDPASLHPALAVQANGTVTVVFQDNRFDPNPGWTGETGFNGGFEGVDRTDPDNWEILARSRDPATGAWSAPVRVSANGSNDPFDETARADRHPALAVAADGITLMAVWDAKPLRSAGVNSEVHASHSTDGGLSWSAPAAVDDSVSAMQQRPAVGPAGAGFAVAWMDNRDADWRHRIWARQWQPETGWAMDRRRLSGPGNAGWPRLAGSRLLWTSDRGASAGQRDPTWQVWQRVID
ncbi:CehA/McbA family metallohydrolase [Flagellatimonas centrodinii]|uniref:CehA/McbA family metallohydrolase n=1 Tax=Flagellatimonas centrodinii TaxID=2806210 RepID=UPI001FEDBD2B|nr:CehA/McbA family metallohydrolase [Flagellatimonas centrodinii]ULQ46013.1 CehA/McbA family metallohydrolase [Flagellatimonas centrodinii]